MTFPTNDHTTRLNERIDAFLEENYERVWPSHDAVVQALFLSLSGEDVDDYNARRCFLELVSTPTAEDVLDYLRVSTARRWAPGPNNTFYRKNPVTNNVDTSSAHPASAVRADYLRRKDLMEDGVDHFNAIGLTVVREIANDASLANQERIDSILNVRAIFNVPTRDEFIFGGDGRITRIEFAADDEHFDEAVIAAMGL